MNPAWKMFRFFETEPTARKYLTACYDSMGLEHADRLAFHQSSRFLFLWKQARKFYTTAANADLSIQPLLLFYGCSHLLKGMLLTRDPSYPQNSRVLQHGVTTRKLKRNTYLLLEDEVRPQKEGFFALLAQRFHLSPLQDRYAMHDLFASIPAVSDVYAALSEKPQHWLQVDWSKIYRTEQAPSDSESWVQITFPEKMDGPLAYSSETFIQYINRVRTESSGLQVHWREGSPKQVLLPSSALSHLDRHPLFRWHAHRLFFWNGSSDSLPLPEWASHFLLLYLLSMLCRYETEWWGELVLSHGLAERSLVELFLEYHMSDYPAVIMRQIQQKNSSLALGLSFDAY
ncbi:YaaC family protein [Brevibacillus sp. SAFN-007a]|uniref:YaaC family protein n=1 Tax=Brevibacillus sp. SAFN-007a TaxID=3436862 RepID=UPI003F7E41E5